MPQKRQDELPEYVYSGPFGGIQSEVSIGQIGNTGFQEVQNLIFRLSQASLIPGFTVLPTPSSEPIIGIWDFFNVNGTRRSGVWTPTKMFYWNGAAWVQVTGALTGTASQFMQWAVVGYKIYFSQQKDTIQVWDGITAGFSAVAATVPGKYFTELNFHLIEANTIEAGPTPAPNRVRWSGAGDGTDWTSFSSGQSDLFNNLGPTTGLCRLFQSGFAFQQWGITQIVPTGIGLAPFQFIPMGAVAKGNILPYSLASFGEIVACYVGKDDIYLFDGTSSQGIGSKPIDGNRRLGARSRIYNDLFTALLTNIFGFILTDANGVNYESYWLFIPSLNKVWIYHFDEGNWTQAYSNPGQLVGPVGVFPLQSIPTIAQLVGKILAQSWSPATLGNANALDSMATSEANTIGFLTPELASTAPTSGSINPNDGWYIKSGQLTFDDTRHAHTVFSVRLMVVDNGSVTYNLRLTNEVGQQVLCAPVTIGTGTGNMITIVIEVPSGITGKYITWELSGPQGVNMSLAEVALIYQNSGEVRVGNV